MIRTEHLLQIAWIFLNCYLYSALIQANNLLVPAATPLSSFGSALGASAMGFALERGGLPGALGLAVRLLRRLPATKKSIPSDRKGIPADKKRIDATTI